MARPIHVFISHKERDKELARRIKGLLLQRGKPGRLRVFASSDAGDLPGTQWFPFIHRELAQAHSLILLYTDPRQVWDWCLYEAGYFAGRFGDVSDVNNLFVLHPRRVPRPAPLQQWHSVVADETVIDGVLEKLYRTPRGGCCFDGKAEDRRSLAIEIRKEMEAFEPVAILPPLKPLLILEGSATSELLGGGEPGAGVTYRVTVHIDADAAAALRLPEQFYSLEDFLKRPEVSEARLDGDTLPKLLAGLLTSRSIGNSPLPPCVIDGQAWRPIIDDASLTSGKALLKIGLQRIQPNLDASTSYGLEALSEIARLAVRFRATVVDQYAKALDEHSSLTATCASALAKPLLHDVQTHAGEAIAAGLNTERAILRAFRDAEHSNIKDLGEQWRRGLSLLREVADNRTAHPGALHQAFSVLRSTNFRYLVAACAELNRLAQTLEPPPAVRQLPGTPVASAEDRPLWRRLLGI
jgi:hypothetical protein